MYHIHKPTPRNWKVNIQPSVPKTRTKVEIPIGATAFVAKGGGGWSSRKLASAFKAHHPANPVYRPYRSYRRGYYY